MSPQRIIVFGTPGQFGTDLVEILGQDGEFEVVPLRHSDCDCTDANRVAQVIATSRPNAVVNCAAYVRVDDSEEHASEAFNVNAIGALNIARACAVVNALCVYISTDYVFDGTKTTPYTESDVPNPINIYGASKLAGEYLTRQAALRWLIVRTASLFGKTAGRGKGGNFIETIIAKAKRGEVLKVVNDIRISPTYSRDAAQALVRLIRENCDGLVHLTNSGTCTWYEFAQQALELAGLSAAVNPVRSSESPAPAQRPHNSALSNERLLLNLRPWKEALRAYLIEKGHIPPRD